MKSVTFSHGAAVFAGLLLTSRSVLATDLQVQVTTPAGAPLSDAVVYLSPETPTSYPPPPRTIIDQVNRHFVPRITVLQAGSSVDFPNSDNIRHSVYSFSPAKTFTLKIYAGTPAHPVVFDKPGIVVLGCDIHDSMVAWAVVVDSPFFARTDTHGIARLPNVAPGSYRLRAWHEPMASEQPGVRVSVDGAAIDGTQKLTLDAGAVGAVDQPSMPGMTH